MRQKPNASTKPFMTHKAPRVVNTYIGTINERSSDWKSKNWIIKLRPMIPTPTAIQVRPRWNRRRFFSLVASTLLSFGALLWLEVFGSILYALRLFWRWQGKKNLNWNKRINVEGYLVCLFLCSTIDPAIKCLIILYPQRNWSISTLLILPEYRYSSFHEQGSLHIPFSFPIFTQLTHSS